MSSPTTFISRRYLSAGSGRSLISIITGISILGVGLGVASLVVVLSVMNGFYSFVRDMLVSVHPHVKVESVGERGLSNATEIIEQAKQLEGVDGVFAFVEGKALLLHDGDGRVNVIVRVRGIDNESRKGTGVEEHIFFGAANIDRVDGKPGVLLSSELGGRLGLTPASENLAASKVSLLSANGLEKSVTRILGAPPAMSFEVRGLYDLQSSFDESYIFIGFEEAKALFDLGDNATAVEIRLADFQQAPAVKDKLGALLSDSGVSIETWYEAQQSLYDVMRLEKRGASVILFLIILVAAFTIVGSLTMAVVEKRRDIAILKSMGMTNRDIQKVFLKEGTMIGVIGTAAGLAVGLGLCMAQQQFKLVSMAEKESFLLDAYPVAIHATDVALITVAALLLCIVASFYPARRASRIVPATVLSER